MTVGKWGRSRFGKWHYFLENHWFSLCGLSAKSGLIGIGDEPKRKCASCARLLKRLEEAVK